MSIFRRNLMIRKQKKPEQNLATVTYSKNLVNATSRKAYQTELRGRVEQNKQYRLQYDIHVHCDSSDQNSWAIEVWQYGLWNHYMVRSGGDLPQDKDKDFHVDVIMTAGESRNEKENIMQFLISHIVGYVEFSNFIITEV